MILAALTNSSKHRSMQPAQESSIGARQLPSSRSGQQTIVEVFTEASLTP